MMKMRDVYGLLALINDLMAILNGRIGKRMWNRTVMKNTRRLMR